MNVNAYGDVTGADLVEDAVLDELEGTYLYRNNHSRTRCRNDAQRRGWDEAAQRHADRYNRSMWDNLMPMPEGENW